MSKTKKHHEDINPDEKHLGELTEEECDAEDDAIGEEENSEAAKLREQLLRAHAQIDNIKRRAERDIQQAHKFASEKLLKELLPIVDSLEHALEASNKADDNQIEAFKAMHDGLILTHKMFLDTLKKFSVIQINPLHETFDPNQHEAMTMAPTDEHKPNTVITVIQKGYKLHDRVVRPARVVVAKAL